MKYWNNIETNFGNPLLQDAYQCIQELHNSGHNTWLKFATRIKNFIKPSGESWAPVPSDIKLLKAKLQENYAHFWEKSIMDDTKAKSVHGRKLRTFRKFKPWFGREPYLDVVRNSKWRICLSRFRMSAHRLMIEVGRSAKIDLDHRLCPKCNLNSVEDELHFLCMCPTYSNERAKLMQTVEAISPLFKQLNLEDQFCWIMSNHDERVIIAMAEYVYTAMERRHLPC